MFGNFDTCYRVSETSQLSLTITRSSAASITRTCIFAILGLDCTFSECMPCWTMIYCAFFARPFQFSHDRRRAARADCRPAAALLMPIWRCMSSSNFRIFRTFSRLTYNTACMKLGCVLQICHTCFVRLIDHAPHLCWRDACVSASIRLSPFARCAVSFNLMYTN